MDLHRLNVRDCVARIQEEDRSIPDALARATDSITAFIEAVLPRFRSGGRLIYIGAGTSGRLGVLDASEAPPTFHIEPGRIVGVIAGGDQALRKSSEGLEDDPDGAIPALIELGLNGRDSLLGIAAGGTTPYVLGALMYAGGLKPSPLTGLLLCSSVGESVYTDHLIEIPTGPEVLTGSTRMKAGTATKLALNTISTTLMIQTGRVYQNLMVDLKPTNQKLTDRAIRIISILTGLDRLQAAELLHHSGESVKRSIVMTKLGISKEEAESILDISEGRLDRALGEKDVGDGA
jgi:N-acetylmuramic acid 6-phosphate etherase